MTHQGAASTAARTPASPDVAPAELLQVAGLTVEFSTPRGTVSAVEDLNFSIGAGEIVGLVGESGSGKTVTGLSLMGLLPSTTATVTGDLRLGGRELLTLSREEMREVRGRDMAMVFQEPMTALDPVFTVGHQMVEAVRAHEDVSRSIARQRAADLLAEVGIPDPVARLKTYPSQLSGGMQQRVMMALSLVCNPSLLIADEPTTALDVTIQAQVLELLVSLSRARAMAVLLITHDLGVVANTCERVMTMYAGQLIEDGEVDTVLSQPQHPYTEGLLHAIPMAGQRGNRLRSIPGRVPVLGKMPAGCRFHPRCSYAAPECQRPQELRQVGDGAHLTRCGRHEAVSLVGMG